MLLLVSHIANNEIISCLFRCIAIKVRDELKNGDKYTAFVVEDKKSDFLNLPEFEVEKRVMEFADIIIIIDSIDTAESRRCPGLSS